MSYRTYQRKDAESAAAQPAAEEVSPLLGEQKPESAEQRQRLN